MAAPRWRIVFEELKRLAVPSGREALGKFSLEGLRSMERALRSDLPIEVALVSDNLMALNRNREKDLIDEIQQRGIELEVAPASDFAQLTGGRGLGDVMAVLPQPPQPSLERLLHKDECPLLLVGQDLADPGNTGALIRTALASGATAFVAVGATDPWNPRSVRTSMGSLFKCPILSFNSCESALAEFRKHDVQTVATIPDDGVSLRSFRREKRCAVFMGSEAFGLPSELVRQIKSKVYIPMPKGVDSFSVNAAAAVVLYALQRGSPGED